MDNFDPYNVLLAIATNIPQRLMTRDQPIYRFTDIFPIFKHFTIIGYRFFYFIFYTYIIIQSIASSEILTYI